MDWTLVAIFAYVVMCVVNHCCRGVGWDLSLLGCWGLLLVLGLWSVDVLW